MSDWNRHVPQGPARGLIVEFLRAAEAMGCTVQIPVARRDDYVNVRAPSSSRRRGRLASVHVRSGSVELQADSWDRLLDKRGYRHLGAGNKAARSLHRQSDLDSLVAALRHELDVTR